MRAQSSRTWLALVLLLLLPPGCTGGEAPEQRFQEFASAVERGDMESVGALYAPDATWQLGPRLLRGVDEIMAFHENDRALGARFVRSDIRVSGDTVIHDVAETNELFRLLRVPPLQHRGVAFVYHNGLIKWEGPAPGRTLPDDSATSFLQRQFGPFRRWWLGAHPEFRDSIQLPDGRLRVGVSAARLRLQLAREYVVLQYIDAANRHDLAWIRDLFTDDVIWDLAGDVRRGIDEVMAPHEQDVVTDTHLDVAIRRVDGDTVITDIVERNSFVSAFGLDSLAHPGIAFVFRGPRIAHFGPLNEDTGPDPFAEKLAPFFAWIREEHPDDWALLVDGDGRPRYGEAGGRTLLRLAAEWNRRTAR